MTSERKIYVGNLPPDTSSRDIEKLFNCFGKILDIDIKNRNGPPFAFITFEDKRDADDAIRERDGYDLDGFSLRVEFPREIKPSRREFNEYPRYDNSHYVPPYDPYDMYVPYSYPQFPRHERFRYYGSEYRGHPYNVSGGGHHASGPYGARYSAPHTRRPRPPRSTDYRVCISSLPPNSNWQDLKDFMRRYGEVSYADVFTNGYGVVDFVAKEDFRYVLKYVNNVKFKSASGHSSYVKVEEDRTRKRGYQRRSSKSRQRSKTRSRSRSAKSKSVSSKSSCSKSSARSDSSTRSVKERQSRSKDV